MSSITSAVQIAISFVIALVAPPLFAQGTFYEGPVSVAGIFNGNVSSGGSYDPLTHSAHRAIDDIVVPGSIGKYPLKMTRYYNSRAQYYALSAIGLSVGWAHEYSWLMWTAGHRVVSPHGTAYDDYCGPPVGVSEGWEGAHDSLSGTWRLADGGKVIFAGGHATDIYDPYTLRTRIAYDATGQRVKVTEPGGRCLWFTYGSLDPDGTKLLTSVKAYNVDGSPGSPTLPSGTIIETVTYSYTSMPSGGSGPNKMMLTGVTYSDGSSASYTYTTDNVSPALNKYYPLLQRCDDARHNRPMRTIFYDYQSLGPHGAIVDEKYPGVGNVSAIAPVLPTGNSGSPDTFTETRGDGPTRTFTYTHLVPCVGDDCNGACAAYGESEPHNKMLTDYTDFQGHNTHIGYDANWYVNSVKDANNNTTTYTRGAPPPTGIGQITQIMYPGNQHHIDYTYQPEPGVIGGHYLYTVTNERGYVTTYHRDAITQQVYQIDYPDSGDYETFTYNPFGQVLNHRLRNGAYERFAYDSRGLLTDKWNPKQGVVPADGDPHTHYDYYTAADNRSGWIDRVKIVSLPKNSYNLIASETYEYERAYDSYGITNLNGGAVAGRGLPTKVTHGDQRYQTFKYDWYGNKAWQDDELRNATSYTYDNYNRRLSITEPLTPAANYTYLPTNGTGTSPYLHTTNNPDTITSPAGIVTKHVYDENFRKESTTAAYGTALQAITSFDYDNVGNLTWVTDPLNHQTYNTYDARNRKLSTTEAYGTSIQRTTAWHYDGAGNIFQIDRPDTTQETKSYDEMNRVRTDTVPKTATVNIVTTFNYNPSGTIASVKDAENRYTYFSYDASDRKTMMTYPPINGHSDTQQWQYDDAGNLYLRTTVAGDQEAFFYNIRNFKFGSWWNTDWNNGVVDWCSFTYDLTGRLTDAENGTNGWGDNMISDVQRAYDADGRLTQEKQIVTGLGTKTVNYPTHDNDGRLTRMSVSEAPQYDFTYSYDAMGRFEKIFLTSGGAQLFQYYYDAASNEIERDNSLPTNQVIQLSPRDALNRMTTWDARKGTSTLAHEGYTYDAMNRITLVDWANGNTDSFTYYLDGELKVANLGNFGHNITYNIDNMGNRTSVVDNTVQSTYSPNPINEYTTGAGSSVGNGSEHEISDYQAVHYTYINDERLSSAMNGGTGYSMTYDALGRCVKRTLNGGGPDSLRPIPTPHGSPTPPPRPSATPTPTPVPGAVTTYYVYDGEKPILEYDSSGMSVGTNLYGKGVDEILERVAFGSDNQSYTYFLQQNHEGSVTLLTDMNGDVLERYRYDAFGAPTIYTGTWGTISSTMYDNRFLFTGREYAATYRSTYTTPLFNFYEYRARAYNPTLGRFMSEDPKLFDAGDYNLFRYCHNDPIDFTDPMGLDAMANAMAVAEVVVPGQYEYNQMVANFQAGNYCTAAGWGVTMAASTVVGVLSGTSTTRVQAGLRAAETAATQRNVLAVIGKFKDVPNYVQVGEHLNKKVFNISPQLWKEMTPAQRWAATQKFLDGVMAQKGDILLHKSIESIESQSGEFRKELNYISQKGFVLSQDGWSMTRTAEEADTASRHVPLPLKP